MLPPLPLPPHLFLFFPFLFPSNLWQLFPIFLTPFLLFLSPVPPVSRNIKLSNPQLSSFLFSLFCLFPNTYDHLHDLLNVCFFFFFNVSADSSTASVWIPPVTFPNLRNLNASHALAVFADNSSSPPFHSPL